MKLQDTFYSLNTNVFYPHFLLICEFCQLWSWEVGIRNRSCDQITKQAEILPSATWAVRNCRKISSSNHVVTYVTFIQNIIVNLILLNNIGVQWSCTFVLQAVWKLWGRWSDSSRVPWWCPSSWNPTVSPLVSPLIFFILLRLHITLDVPLGSQIAWHGLSQPMQKDSQGCRQCGQTRNTMDVTHFPQRWLLRSRGQFMNTLHSYRIEYRIYWFSHFYHNSIHYAFCSSLGGDFAKMAWLRKQNPRVRTLHNHVSSWCLLPYTWMT